MRLISCSLRRYTIGRLPSDESQLTKAIEKINGENAEIEEYDEHALFQILEDVDDELYFDGPEFNDGDITLELDDGKTIILRDLIEHGAIVKSLEKKQVPICPKHNYCCTDQQGDGEIDQLGISEKAEQLINEASQSISSGNASKHTASNLAILTKTWSTPWEKLTMLLGITTQDKSEIDYKDNWGDGSYSMDVNNEEAFIYQSTHDGWTRLEQSQILLLLESSGISTADWAEQESSRNMEEFRIALTEGGHGNGSIPFIQEKIRGHELTREQVIDFKSTSSYAPEMTACFAHALSYEPININLPAGCKYFLKIYSHSDGGSLANPLKEQELRESIDIRIMGINYQDDNQRLQQYRMPYDNKQCMINFIIEQNLQEGGCTVELKSLAISVPLIESFDWEELAEKSLEDIAGDNSYKTALLKWEELRDTAARGGRIDVSGIEVKQRIEFWHLRF